MPSKARCLFRDKLLPDVAALIATHREVNPNGQGRRALGHITRSRVIMLCAAWELYIEEVLKESVDFLVEGAASPDFLPDGVKGRIAQVAKTDVHAFGALKLCGDGWKQVFQQGVDKDVANLNTPKFGPISEIYKKWLAVDDISKDWRHSSAKLNAFVTLRGEIAHRGADAHYVRISELVSLKSVVDEIVVDTDRTLGKYLKEISYSKKLPWRS